MRTSSALLERRLDSVVFRAGFAQSRDDARQLVLHRHVLLNGKITKTPSILVASRDDVVSVKEKSQGHRARARSTRACAVPLHPGWLSTNLETVRGQRSSACPSVRRSTRRSKSRSSSSSTRASERVRPLSRCPRRRIQLLTLVRATVSEEQVNERLSRFIVEPLEPGFGYTVGNAMRRTLLSSVPGAAIALVKVEGVLHEFTTIPGVTEDVTELVLNIKDIVVRMESRRAVGHAAAPRAGAEGRHRRRHRDAGGAHDREPGPARRDAQRQGPPRHGAHRRARDRLRGRRPDEAARTSSASSPSTRSSRRSGA